MLPTTYHPLQFYLRSVITHNAIFLDSVSLQTADCFPSDLLSRFGTQVTHSGTTRHASSNVQYCSVIFSFRIPFTRSKSVQLVQVQLGSTIWKFPNLVFIINGIPHTASSCCFKSTTCCCNTAFLSTTRCYFHCSTTSSISSGTYRWFSFGEAYQKW